MPAVAVPACRHSWRSEVTRVWVAPDVLRWDAVVRCALCPVLPGEVADRAGGTGDPGPTQDPDRDEP
jgi:hypothetical protein